MNPRTSSKERIRVTNRAEAEILRFKGDHLLWHKHVHGAELDPMQVLKMMEMDRHPNTIDVSCRRTRKTSAKEMHILEELATTPHIEEGIVAPRQQQSQTNIKYHLDAIQRSPILKGFIAYRRGREQLTDTRYQFANGSGAQAYGIMSQIDGDSLVIASLEEVDDMPKERLTANFLPMLGATERLGVLRDRAVRPQIRITGVFKGADTLQELIESGAYHMLPTVNLYDGLELGIINESVMMALRSQMTNYEYIRQFLCRNVSAMNWIWERHVRTAIQVGVKAEIEPAGPVPGQTYKGIRGAGRAGLIGFGYDHLGHGEDPAASKSALVVVEQIGSFTCFIYAKTWAAATDEKVIERDLVGLWEYFRPDYAFGDAYGIGLLTGVNDQLYRKGLTAIDRQTIGDGESSATTWKEWAFSPIRFEGMVKHSMASALRSIFHNGQAAIPYHDDTADGSDWALLVRQLGNIRADKTRASYASFAMIKKSHGDDLFDAAMAAVWALVTRGAISVPTVIGTRTQTREQLLGQAPRLPLRPAA